MSTAAPPQIQLRMPRNWTRDREYLSPGQRFGEVIALAVLAVIIDYFWQLWQMEAGFFTAAFGPWEQFWFFGPMVVSLAAPLVRLLVGRRNPARPFEIATDVLMVIGAVWLLRVFPFDFSHIGGALPGSLPTLFAWVPKWLGRWVLVLQLVGGTIAVVVTAWHFVKRILLG